MTKDEEAYVSQSKHVLPVVTMLPPINLKASNLALEWRNWSVQFNINLRASNLEELSDARKVALLLFQLGSACMQEFSSFNKDVDNAKFDVLIKRFDAYFEPKANIAMERHKFFTYKQRDDQSIAEFVAQLQNLSATCEFDALREYLIRDIFICGLSPHFAHIKERLLGEGGIKLNKAIDIAQSIEMAKESANVLKGASSNMEHSLAALKRQQFSMQQGSSMSSSKFF